MIDDNVLAQMRRAAVKAAVQITVMIIVVAFVAKSVISALFDQ